MIDVMRTCPACGTRVLPSEDGQCPACRRHKFQAGDSEPPSGSRPVPRSPDLHDLGVLHWQVTLLLITLVGLVILNGAVRAIARPAIAGAGVDWRLLGAVLDASGILVFILYVLAARRLAQLIGVGNWHNVLSLLKQSTRYFEDHGVSVSSLGPRLASIPRAKVE
jgi:hypothetical protein